MGLQTSSQVVASTGLLDILSKILSAGLRHTLALQEQKIPIAFVLTKADSLQENSIRSGKSSEDRQSFEDEIRANFIKAYNFPANYGENLFFIVASSAFMQSGKRYTSLGRTFNKIDEERLLAFMGDMCGKKAKHDVMTSSSFPFFILFCSCLQYLIEEP